MILYSCCCHTYPQPNQSHVLQRQSQGKKVVMERVVKPSDEQEEINKMAKEEVQQETRSANDLAWCVQIYSPNTY